MDLAIMIADLERTGLAEVLQEQSVARPAFHEYYEREVRIAVPETITWGYLEPRRYLSIEEQQVFTKALRRSVRVVLKAGGQM